MDKSIFISPDNPYKQSTGGQISDLNTIRSFSRYSEVILFTINDGKVEGEGEIFWLLRNLPKADSLVGRIWAFISAFSSFLPRAAQLLNNKDNAKKIETVIRERHCAHLFFNHLESAVLNKHIRAEGIKRYLIHHNIESELIYDNLRIERKLLMKMYLFLEYIKTRIMEKNIINQRSDCSHLFVSVDDMEKFKSYKIEALHFPVRCFDGKIGPSEEEENIIYIIGNWDHLPNRHGLKAVIRTLATLFPKETIMISGKDSEGEIERLSKTFSNISYIGFLPQDKMHAMLNRAKIVLVPIFYGAGVKMKLIEALQCSANILTTAFGIKGMPWKDEIHGCVTLFDLNDLGSKITELVNDRERRYKMRVRAEGYVNKYFEHADKVLEELFK